MMNQNGPVQELTRNIEDNASALHLKAAPIGLVSGASRRVEARSLIDKLRHLLNELETELNRT